MTVSMLYCCFKRLSLHNFSDAVFTVSTVHCLRSCADDFCPVLLDSSDLTADLQRCCLKS